MAATMLSAFGIELKEVVIPQLPNGVFAADLVMTDCIRNISIDARSSYAVAMAIRCGAPIFCTDEVMEKASFDHKERTGGANEAPAAASAQQPPRPGKASELTHMTDAELQKAMETAVAEENYEEAARIKDELDRRSK